MPKRSKRKAPASAAKRLKLDKKEDTPKLTKSMEDLPPEVVTIILDHLIRNESRKDILTYRLVNRQWKDIISSLLEKKITSGHLPSFPVMRIHPPRKTSKEDLLYVRHSPTMLPGDRNPFPSNSLLLYGNGGGIIPHFFPESVKDIQRMDLADFMAQSGGYLTNLTLKIVTIPGMNSLVTLLSSLSSLKVLSLVSVNFEDRIIKPSLVFPTPPVMPSLTTLNVKCGRYYTTPTGDDDEPGRVIEKRHILYIWLIVSYADQLLHLSVKTGEALPFLQRGTQYFYCFPNKTRLSVATISDAAFTNLKELITEHPNEMIMKDIELPKLQRISLAGNSWHFEGDIYDVTNFIGKCRSSLQKFRLDAPWDILKVGDDEYEEIMPRPIIGSPFPKLKTLEIQYSPGDDNSDEIIISRVVALFPALQSLHFLRFQEFNTTSPQKLETKHDDVGNADKIADAKSRLAALEKMLHIRTTRYRQQRAAIPPRVRNREDRINVLYRELNAFRGVIDAERTEIFKELAALGVTKQQVLVAQFLEREGIWNICPKLKLVSVSSDGQPVGDLCILQRPEQV